MQASFEAVTPAYSVLVLTADSLCAIRDSFGMRLSIGRCRDALLVSSETCALDVVGADVVRDVEPGEMVLITSEGIRTVFHRGRARAAQCIFELILCMANC